jgi:hypothetical protein
MAHTPQHYRDTAVSLRALAASLPDTHLRGELLKLAADYEVLASRAEERDADWAADPPAAKSK